MTGLHKLPDANWFFLHERVEMIIDIKRIFLIMNSIIDL